MHHVFERKKKTQLSLKHVFFPVLKSPVGVRPALLSAFHPETWGGRRGGEGRDSSRVKFGPLFLNLVLTRTSLLTNSKSGTFPTSKIKKNKKNQSKKVEVTPTDL